MQWFAGEKFERVGQLAAVDTALDIGIDAMEARLGARVGDAGTAVADAPAERLGLLAARISLLPVRQCARDRIAEDEDQLNRVVVGVDPLQRVRLIEGDRGRFTAQARRVGEQGRVGAVVRRVPADPLLVVEEMRFLHRRRFERGQFRQTIVQCAGARHLHAGDEEADALAGVGLPHFSRSAVRIASVIGPSR